MAAAIEPTLAALMGDRSHLARDEARGDRRLDQGSGSDGLGHFAEARAVEVDPQ